MHKILLATSVFALSVGIATAQSTGSVTPSPATPSTTTGTSQGTTSTQPGTTSTQPGTTSTQPGTTSTTGSGSMGTLQTTQPGSTTSGSPAATQGTPGVAGSAGSVTGGTQGSTQTTTGTSTPQRRARLPIALGLQQLRAARLQRATLLQLEIALPARVPRRQHQLHARAERQQLLPARPVSREAPQLRAALPRTELTPVQPHPAILLHRAIWAQDLQLSPRNRLLTKA